MGRKTVELLTTNHTGDLFIYNRGHGYGFGLGVYVRLNLSGIPLPGSVGTFGRGGAYGTWLFVDPKQDLIGIFFSQLRAHNQNPDLRIWPRFQKMVYQAIVD